MGVTIRQKIPGKGNPWWVFVAHNNQRLSRMVGSKEAAVYVANQIEAKLTLGQFDIEEERSQKEEKSQPTFKEYADSWINTIAPANNKEATVSSYEDLLRLHILPVFGSFKLSEMNKGKLKDFFASKILNGYAKSSVVHMKSVISGILTLAVDNEVIPNNLSKGIKIEQKNGSGEADESGDEEEDGTINPLTAEETKLFLDTARDHFSKDYPLCLLLLRTGMRIGEALALRWGDIDFHGRFIHVKRGLSRKKIETPKTGKTRRVDMSPQLAETLTAWKTECKKKGLALGLGDAPEYIFTDQKGGFIDLSNWRRRVFWKILDKAELRRIRVNDCRHTYATLRISKSDNVADVSNQLGHSKVTTTLDNYYHWLPGNKKDEVDQLDEIGTPKEEKRQAVNEG